MHTVRRTSPDTAAAKAFVLRSGCSLLPHPWTPGHIILHGGRSVADVQPTSVAAPTAHEKLLLDDWHLLVLSAPSSASAAPEVHATPLHTSAAVSQARLQSCKHCLVAATTAAQGSRLPVAVLGGSRGITSPRPCTMVAVDVHSRRVALVDPARISALQAITPSLQHAMCCGTADVRGGRGAACMLPSSREFVLVATALTNDGVEEGWSESLALPPQDEPQALWSALCVAGETAGRGRMIAVAQCAVRETLTGVYVWFPQAPGEGAGKAAHDGCATRGDNTRQQRQLLLSPAAAAAKVQQARKEAEARCGCLPHAPPRHLRPMS